MRLNPRVHGVPALIDRVRCALIDPARVFLPANRSDSRDVHRIIDPPERFCTPQRGYFASVRIRIRFQTFAPKSKANCLSPALVNSCLYISSNTLIGNVHI